MLARVLIVDDEEHNLVALEAGRRKPGREIVCVQSGQHAIDEFRRCPATVALLDVMMPRMTDVETARGLRLLAPRLPIIFVTAAADDIAVQAAATRLGALGCLLMPVDVGALGARLNELERT